MERGTFDLMSGEWSDPAGPRDPYPWNHRRRPKHRKDRPAETVFPFGASEGVRPPLRPTEHVPWPDLPGSPIGLEPDRYPWKNGDGRPRGPGAVRTVRTTGPRGV